MLIVKQQFPCYNDHCPGWKGANIIFAALCLQCAVFGALMRPLSVQVTLKEEEAAQDEDGWENISMQCKNICTPRCRCVLRLPDGSTVTSTVGGDTGGSKVSLTESQSPSHGRLPLPTITEQVLR